MAQSPQQTGGGMVKQAGVNVLTDLTKAVISPPQFSYASAVHSPRPSPASSSTAGGGASSDANPQKISVPFGQLDIQQRPKGRSNSEDKSISFSGTKAEKIEVVDVDKLNRLSRDGYNTMKEIVEASSDPIMPATMTAISAPKLRQPQVWFASSVKGGELPRQVHIKLAKAIPGAKHRAGFSCGEMQAVNDILVAQKGILPEGLFLKTFGTPDREDAGAKGAKMVMPPCKEDEQGKGCQQYLEALGIRFP